MTARFSGFLITILLAACSVPGGHFTAASRNSLELPARFDGSAPPVPELVSSLRQVFPSREMSGLITRALSRNPDLRASAARLEEAGFSTRRAQALLSPSLSANSGVSRSRSNFAGSGLGARSFITERYSATLDAQWELDVWGRIRAGVTAASADQQAAAADYAAARQSIAAQVAQAYFELVGVTQQIELSQRSLESFLSTEKLVNRRFEAGLAGLGDVNLATTDVERVRAELSSRRDSRDRAARSLSALTGAYPGSGLSASTFPSLRRTVPAGLPSTLLRRRPDIDAAYQRIRAADANLTVAHASLYPSFALTGQAGRQSGDLRGILNPSQTVWTLAGNLSAPLFAGGRLRADIGAANARAKQALANYQSTVLTALREVENALGSERALASQEVSALASLKAAKSAEESVRRSFENGLVEILSLLDAQRRAFTAEETLITIRTARFQNRVALALALGKAY